MLIGKFAEPMNEVVPYAESVLLQLFPIDDLQYGSSLCAHNRIATECIEMDSFGQTLCDLGCGYHGGERCTVSDSLSHGNDIWYHALSFESPVRLTGPAKTGLNFVRDTDASSFSHILINMPEVAIWKDDRAANTLNRFRDKPCYAARRRIVNKIQNIVSIRLTRFRVIVSVRSAVRIRSD